MKRKRLRKQKNFPVYRLDPSARLCPSFDETSIALFPVADYDKMGVVVQDNCAEEHMQ